MIEKRTRYVYRQDKQIAARYVKSETIASKPVNRLNKQGKELADPMNEDPSMQFVTLPENAASCIRLSAVVYCRLLQMLTTTLRAHVIIHIIDTNLQLKTSNNCLYVIELTGGFERNLVSNSNIKLSNYAPPKKGQSSFPRHFW